MLYTYKVSDIRVIDGDTLECSIDLGFHIWLRNVSIRVYGVNTPEIRGTYKDAGIAAMQFTRDWVANYPDGIVVKIAEKPDKYGRVLGSVIKTMGNETFILANDIIKHGHGEEYYGGTKGTGVTGGDGGSLPKTPTAT